MNIKSVACASMLVGVTLLIVVGGVTARAQPQRPDAAAMSEAAKTFLKSLSPEQRAQATFKFDDEERLNWHFTAKSRRGIALKELNPNQRNLARNFLKTGVSQSGYLKATTIMQLELVLREIENNPSRDPELYYFSIFGAPSMRDPWGWRVEGHHLSLNFTLVNGKMIATTPTFFGANPAEVRRGEHQGLRVLRAEEEVARELLGALDEKQCAKAVFDRSAPPEIVTRAARKVDPLTPVGIAAKELNLRQKSLLIKLLDEYASSMPAKLAAERLDKVRGAGLEEIRFAWAGGTERGQPHYYRIQGPTFLIEYDNTQNNANHVHTVWRDFDGDFGRDLLREHYRDTPHNGSH